MAVWSTVQQTLTIPSPRHRFPASPSLDQGIRMHRDLGALGATIDDRAMEHALGGPDPTTAQHPKNRVLSVDKAFPVNGISPIR